MSERVILGKVFAMLKATPLDTSEDGLAVPLLRYSKKDVERAVFLALEEARKEPVVSVVELEKFLDGCSYFVADGVKFVSKHEVLSFIRGRGK